MVSQRELLSERNHRRDMVLNSGKNSLADPLSYAPIDLLSRLIWINCIVLNRKTPDSIRLISQSQRFLSAVDSVNLTSPQTVH